MKTFAVYQKTPDGMLRLGTVKSNPSLFGTGTSVRQISMAIAHKYPSLDLSTVFIARVKLFGRWTDGDKLPAEVQRDGVVPTSCGDVAWTMHGVANPHASDDCGKGTSVSFLESTRSIDQ